MIRRKFLETLGLAVPAAAVATAAQAERNDALPASAPSPQEFYRLFVDNALVSLPVQMHSDPKAQALIQAVATGLAACYGRLLRG